jgi:integrase
MLRRKVPVEVVSKTLGHANIAITYAVYRHVLESERQEHVIDFFPEAAKPKPLGVSALN